MDTSGDDNNQQNIQGSGGRQAASNIGQPVSVSQSIQGQQQVSQPMSGEDQIVQQTGQQDTGQIGAQQVQQPQVRPEAQIGRGVGAKEAEFVSQSSPQEQVRVVEIKEPGELPVEVAGYIERAEKDDVAEPKTVVHEGQTIVSSAQPQNVSVTLPLDDEGIKKGMKHKFSESIKWLAAWVERIKKVFKI